MENFESFSFLHIFKHPPKMHAYKKQQPKFLESKFKLPKNIIWPGMRAADYVLLIFVFLNPITVPVIEHVLNSNL